MRKRTVFKHHSTSTPMLSKLGDDDEIKHRACVEAFRGGWATVEHYDDLCDRRNVTTIAAAYKGDNEVLMFCRELLTVLQSIKARFDQVEKMGVTSPEMTMLQEFCGIYRDFWMRQPVKLYEVCTKEVDKLINEENNVEII